MYLLYHYLWITYHFECDHGEVDGFLQAQHECFILNNIFRALEIQETWNQMLSIVWVDQDTPGSWAILCLWSIKVHGPQLVCTRAVWRASTTATTIATGNATIGTIHCTCFISISWAWKESQLRAWLGWSWSCRITPKWCFQEVVAKHKFCEGQQFILAIKRSEIVLHIPLGQYLDLVAFSLVRRPHVGPICGKISVQLAGPVSVE